MLVAVTAQVSDRRLLAKGVDMGMGSSGRFDGFGLRKRVDTREREAPG